VNPLSLAVHLAALVAALAALVEAGSLRLALLRGSRSRLERAAEDRKLSRAGALALRILERPRAPLWRLLAGRSAVEVLTVVFLAGLLRAAGLHPALVFGGTLFLGVLLLHVFGDALPGRTTRGDPEALLLRAGFWGRLLDPDRSLGGIDRAAQAFLSRLGSRAPGAPAPSAAFLRMMEVDATLWDGEEGLFSGLLRLDALVAGDVLVPASGALALEEGTKVGAALERLRETPVARIPVYEGSIETVTGVVYARDLYPLAFDAAARELPVAEHLRDAYFVPRTKPVRDLLAEFRRERVYLAVVLDEGGRTAGFVSLEDILKTLLGEVPR
jgi:putative hemolysin